VLRPLEHWIVGRGGNPQNAEWWLLGGVIVGGILLLSAAGWIADRAAEVSSVSRRRNPLEVVRLLVFYAGQLVSLAIFVRVIGSWVGVGRYNTWMRPAYILTDWIIEPLRKYIPPIGMIDVTPIIAFLIIRMAMFVIF
jgi:YggT family protein